MYCISAKHLNQCHDRSCFMNSNDKSCKNNKKYTHYFTNCFTHNYENIITNMELYLSTCVSPLFIRGLSFYVIFGRFEGDWDNYISAEKKSLSDRRGVGVANEKFQSLVSVKQYLFQYGQGKCIQEKRMQTTIMIWIC